MKSRVNFALTKYILYFKKSLNPSKQFAVKVIFNSVESQNLPWV